MKMKLFAFFAFILFMGNAQIERDSLRADVRYLEDQFYLGVTYNFLLDKPTDVSQRNLSYGFQAGFVKDMPLNTDRTIAFGLGLGYSVYSYYTNLQAFKVGDNISYSIPGDVDNLKRNKIETHMVELPIEFRWRTSTATNYKFYRIYAGAKLGYVFGARSKAVFEDYKESFTNKDVNKFQYGLTFNFGYNTFNLQVYYALNGIFNEVQTEAGEDINFKPLRIGFVFYIL